MNNVDALSARARFMYGLVGFAVLAVAVALIVVGVTPFHSGSSYYTAAFVRAGQGMDTRSDVKIRGITVGGVASVKLEPDGKALIRFRVDHGIRLPVTTVASVEPVSVFGPKDLDLDLGTGETTGGPYLAAGAQVRKVKEVSELSDTAWPLYKLTGEINAEELAGVVHTLAQGLDGEGPALRRTIGNGSTLVNSAYDRKGSIDQAIKDVAALADTFGGRGATIIQFTSDANAVAPVLTDRPDKINQLLDGANRLATGLDGDLRAEGGKFGPLIDAAGRTVHLLAGRNQELPQLFAGLQGFFGGLNTIIRVPGPGGKLIASVYNYLPLNLCQTFVDLCPGSTK
jgi:phospholipid/cholesterol/gamma-HCH transport system substrate-binding protein